MARDIPQRIVAYDRDPDGQYLYTEQRLEIARTLYNAGYRKQSEGEWIKHPASYECTACKEEFFVEGYAEDYDPITDWDLHFCPNCGAKMKGGDKE